MFVLRILKHGLSSNDYKLIYSTHVKFLIFIVKNSPCNALFGDQFVMPFRQRRARNEMSGHCTSGEKDVISSGASIILSFRTTHVFRMMFP